MSHVAHAGLELNRYAAEDDLELLMLLLPPPKCSIGVCHHICPVSLLVLDSTTWGDFVDKQ